MSTSVTAIENCNLREFDFRARYYSPETGRFLSEDPIGYASGDMNYYRYVKNSPVISKDPSGELVLTIIAIGALLLIPELISDDPELVKPIPDQFDKIKEKPANWREKMQDVIDDIHHWLNPPKKIQTQPARCA